MGDTVALSLLNKPLHPAQIFRLVVLGLVVGFVVGTFMYLPWSAALAAGIATAGLIYFQPSLRTIGLVVVGSMLALARASVVPVSPSATAFLGPQHFEATVVAEPNVRGTVAHYIVETPMPGLGPVLLTAQPYPRFAYGQRLEVSCKKVELTDFSGFTAQGIWRQCAFPELRAVGLPAWSLRGTLLGWRSQLGNHIKGVMAEPYASLVTGMLWGDDSGLPTTLTQAFRTTGTSHLLAVSGYNVMVLSEILFTVLIALGLWRRQASVVVIGVVVLFALFTGAEPAVVRASIMASLLVLARLLARRPDRVNILFGTAAAMLLFSPALITSLGFQLSFAAMAGLMFLSPVFEKTFAVLPNIWGLRQSVAQTMAATVTTLPIILLRLDQLSLVSPIANVLVGPVVVLVFVFGLPLVLLSSFGWLASPFVWLLSAVLAYVVLVIESLAVLPWASLNGVWVLVLTAALYGLGAWWSIKKHTLV